MPTGETAAQTAPPTVPAPAYGTFGAPFAAYSPWNLLPVDPVLGSFVIPTSQYYPTLAEGTWSTGAFKAAVTDTAVTVYPLAGQQGVWDPDMEAYRPTVTIPRWPAGVMPASGSDGHADIVDEAMGIVHSFFQLRQDTGGQWRAAQYAWAPLAGRGFGEPAHYYMGARAVGVPAIGGIIRKSEIDDGLPYYRHALAMSLTFNGLSAATPYIFPATSADANAASTNTGGIPQGALVMLPPDFDTSSIQSLKLRKVAETLKRYGAYVVDRNTGTPYVIYVENGSNFNLMPGGWDNETATQLDRIRQALRQVTNVSGWQDGNGQPVIPEQRLNLLSMRGQWSPQRGSPIGVFDTWKQAVVFPAASADVVQVNYSSRVISSVAWAKPVAGVSYRLTARATGGGRLKLQLYSSAGARLFDSGELADGASVDFAWPDGAALRTALYAYSGAAGTQSTVGGTLISNQPLTQTSGKVLMK
ncbi:Atrophin-1 multi-domain protein [Roseateles aquatilis]|uniref:Atrophin-1 multi-domain protein n=2 Tax=Roseateles aquatilis TaxID=431061 RepID=A0A246JMS5_9BURK|nr:Atrophin-1 multi-domain protein [Roseateles aquatilis]